MIENEEIVKKFNQEELDQIFEGKLDYTKYFKEPNSKEKLMDALNGREMTLGFIDP